MKACIFIMFYIFASIFYVLAKDNEIDNITAIVNDQIILNSDVNQILFLLKKEGKDLIIPLKSSFLKEKVIQKLILDSLIIQQANRMNITVTKEQVNAVIKNIALKKNISIDKLKNDMFFHDPNSYLSYNNYMKNIEKLIKIKIIEEYELHRRINISEKKVNFIFKNIVQNNENLKRLNLSYILLPCLKEDSDTTIAKKRILSKNIIDKIKQGYDFEEIYINCKKNKTTFLVKKMFWIRFLDIKNSFSENLNIVKKGQILGPILGDKGFYIFKVNDINNNKENIETEFHVQHCLIKPSIILTNKQSKKMIFNIYKNIKEGVYSFDYAVKHFSHDVYSSNKKGDLGWISADSFNLNLNKELLFLNKNEISKPIKSHFGWHIIKLLDKRKIDKFYNLTKKQAYHVLLDQKILSEKHNWIKDLKKNSYIQIIKS